MIKLNEHCTILKRCTAKSQKVNSTFRAVASKALRQNGFDSEINGEWWHEGQLIKRQALLDLFTKVLWKEEGKFYLKTPVEQIEIEVEDEPLLVNQADQVEISGEQFYN